MAAGDLALTILIGANDIASPVIRGVAASIAGLASSSFGNLGSGISNLIFGLRNLGTAGTVGMDAIKAGAVSAGSGLLALGAIAVVAGTAIAVGIGVAAVHAAADFQQGLNRLVTGAGDVTDNMQKMGQSILGVSVATGVMTGELLPAMYQIISANQRGAQAEDTLRVAAMGSVVEQANVVDVAKALTTAMTDYGTSQYNATQYMNGYTRATQLGKLTLEQLSNSMGPILPLAQNIGISFSDVAGAMSTMTNAGIPAERAATSLRFLFQSLENPTKKATTAMTSMGLSSVAVGNELKKSLPGALEMIYKAALKAGPEGSVPFNRAVSDMIGGQRSLQAYLSLTGSHFATYVANTKAVADAMNGSKTAVLGWDVAQGNFNVKMSQAHAAVAALGITVGTALLPMITRIVGQVTPLVVSFTQWAVQSGALQGTITVLGAVLSGLITSIATMVTWGVRVVQFFQQSQVAGALLEATLIVLAVIIGGVLVVALYSYAAAAYVAAAANIAAFWPVYLVIIIIIVIIAVVILAVKNWGAIAHWLQGVWAAVIGWLIGAWHTLVAAAVATWNAVRNAIMSVVGPVIAWLNNQWHAQAATLDRIWASIAGFATSTWNAVKNAIVSVVNAVISWLVAAWHNAIAFLVGVWNTLRTAATSAFNAIKTAIMTAVNAVITWLVNAWHTTVNAIVAAFQWLYNHNYYFKDLVDAIVRAFTFLKGQVMAIWNTITSFLVGQWNALKNDATSIWNAISSAISTAVNFVVGIVKSVWSAVIGWLGGAWNTLVGLASAAWNFISSVISSAVTIVVAFIKAQWNAAMADLAAIWNFLKGIASAVWNAISSVVSSATNTATSHLESAWNGAKAILDGIWSAIKAAVTTAWNFIVAQFAAAWGRISGPLTSLGSSIKDFFSGLANQALSWGKNIIQGLIDGINSMLGAVGNAASNIASKITGILGFHSPPKEGPARDADTWMPNMVKMFATGIAAGGTSMHSAVGQLLSPLSALNRPLSTQVGVSGSAFAGGRYPTGGGQNTIIVQLPAPSHSDIYLDRDKVGHSVLDYQAKEVRRHGVRNR